MLNAILGTKLKEGQTFTSEGKRIPVTYIKVDPLVVVSVKTVAKDGYNALQLGFGSRRMKTLTKPVQGLFKKAGLEQNPPRFLKEIKLGEFSETDLASYKPGLSIQVGSILKAGDKIEATGISKGKGFQGGVKRHHFKGGPRTHGQSDRERAPGSIGQTTTPGRVYKGKRMAGRMGTDQVTVKGLKVVEINQEKSLLTVSGLVPGGKNSLLTIRKTN